MAELQLSSLLNSGSLIPFDQPEIEAVMRKILYENGVSDIMYPGSNISQLSAVVSYVIASMNVNTAINLQETILPLATKRMNVLFGARQLGYEAHAQIGYKYTLTLTQMYNNKITDVDGDIILDDQTPTSINLVQNTMFQSGNKFYYYKGPTITGFFNFSNFDIQMKNNPSVHPDPSIFYKEIEVTEGVMTKFTEDPALTFIVKDYPDENGYATPKQDYLIPIHDVEDDGLQVFVQSVDYSQAPVNGVRATNIVERKKSKTFLIDDSFTEDKDKFVRMENIILEYPAIFFEFSDMGNPVNTGDEILVNVFQTSGANGRAEDLFIVNDTVASQEFQVATAVLLRKGQNKETSASIKDNAMVFNNTANRAVTKLDYLAITKKHELVKEADAWGGEDETYPGIFDALLPPSLTNNPHSGSPMRGHIWISTSPYSEKDYTYSPGVRPVPAIGTIPAVSGFMEKYELEIGTPKEDIDNLWNWYQSNVAIDSIIEYYKIIAMKLHHRQPLYVNFDFVVDIVKYDMTQSEEKINQAVFIGMKNYFQDQIEQFNADYLNSNLQRVLDIILSYYSGIGFTLTTKGELYKNMIDPVMGDIRIALDYPYENMFDDITGIINPLLLPNIDTSNFGVSNGILSVDVSSLTAAGNEFYYSSGVSDSCPITLDGTHVGSYIVDNIRAVIDIVFNFNSIEDDVFGVDGAHIDPLDTTSRIIGPEGEYAEFNLVYPYSGGGATGNYNHNVPFSQNTLPRLRKVEFKNN